jgi:hypothetical protein
MRDIINKIGGNPLACPTTINFTIKKEYEKIKKASKERVKMMELIFSNVQTEKRLIGPERWKYGNCVETIPWTHLARSGPNIPINTCTINVTTR